MEKKEKFSLKDTLFNKEKVSYLAGLISGADPSFKTQKFIKEVTNKFPELELKARIEWMRICLKKNLPQDYKTAVNTLIEALPSECDPTKTDDDFGDFILSPLSDFIAAYGCNKENLDFSLNALEEMTKRFSAEDSIRYFINAFPEKTLKKMAEWSKNKNYHVRRLASEGSRPSLPWSQKVNLDHTEVTEKILNNLFHDHARYVVRSVANHVNDISKKNPKLVIQTLKKWRKSKKQKTEEMDYLTRHSLRTLIKKGNPEALSLLGYKAKAKISISKFKILTKTVSIGNALEFSFNITALEDENLMIDYILYFQTKNGKLSAKVFKIKKASLKKDAAQTITKKHPLKIMSTKKLYPGLHKVALQINGKIYAEGEFTLK